MASKSKKTKPTAEGITTSNDGTKSADPNNLWVHGVDTEHDIADNFVDDDKTRHTKLDAALVKNIKANGVIQPVLVRIIEGVPVVVDGRRRVLHARKANEERLAEGLEALPVRIALELGGDDVDAKVRAVSANTFRMDHGPVAQGRKAAQLINAGKSVDDVAVALGMSKSSVQNRLKLLELAPAVQRAIEANKIGPMAGLELLGMEKDEQLEALAELIEETEGGKKKKGAAKSAKAKANKGKSDAPERPGIGLINRILKTEGAAELEDMVIKTLKWVAGEIGYSSIKGLAKCIDEATPEPAEKPKKKAPPRE
jgi:ParB/RepB/Spo0J family partition protein